MTKERVLEAVSGVQEPAVGRGLVELKMIPAIEMMVLAISAVAVAAA